MEDNMSNSVKVGERSGRLVVLEVLSLNSEKHVKCKCDCGSVTTRKSKQFRKTKSCGCLRLETNSKTLKGNKNAYKLRKGTANISRTYFNELRRCAKQRKLDFVVSIDDIQYLLEKQNFKCALSNEVLVMSLDNSKYRIREGLAQHNTASLDRKDSSKGYTISNIQWIHKDLNKLKSNMDEKKFIQWCIKVAKNNDLLISV
jgi:hypothetical protein